MAQKIEFLRASNTTELAVKFDTLVESFGGDNRFIITPIGFITDRASGADHYVLAVLVEATHKTTFVGLDAIDAAE